ncbi:MAG TPA: hypothetical protein VKB80_29255 [Kofleriaceae bacterium]|nr:hypothetical protein [Kofleriaceae bacterium]
MFRCGTIAIALLVGAPGWACTPSTVQPDVDGGPGPQEDGGGGGGGTDASTGDGGGGQAGLGLAFGSIPGLPGAVSGTYSAYLEEARVLLHDIRALGDSAPGDSRTTEPSLELRWGEGGGGGDDGGGDDLRSAADDDISVFFAMAPPGKYSDVKADVVSYRMQGTVMVGATQYEFEIEDTPPTPLHVNISLGELQLDANTTRTISIKADLGPSVTEVTWDQVTPEGGGELKIEGGGYPGIATLRESLVAGFALDSGASP